MKDAPVYMAGAGLACSLGNDLSSSVAALRRGEDAAAMPVEAAKGFAWPLRRLPRSEGDWWERLRLTVREVVTRCGLPSAAATAGMPLFVASSSLDVGWEEEKRGAQATQALAGDVQVFADTVAEAIGWRGPVFTVSTACTSAVNAMLAAADLIRGGAVPQALVLGIEFSNRLTLAGFGGMQLLSPERALPFGAGRDGLVLGEAVAAICLAATPARWQLLGGANVVAGATPTGADAGAMQAACAEALRQSGLRPEDVDLLKPQAAGSPANDAVEAEVLKALFAEGVPPMVEFKSRIGHTLGASSAAELALLTACIESSVWPVSDHAPDPALGMVFAHDAPARSTHVLLNAIGFGGDHAAWVMKDHGAGA